VKDRQTTTTGQDKTDMRTSEMLDRKFLGKEDVEPPILVTVIGVAQMPVTGRDDDEEQIKWVLQFKETDKPLILKPTLIHLCEQIFGSDESDTWIGHKLVIFVDPTVTFAGKVTGGIRVRKPKQVKPAATLAPVPPPAPPVELTVDPDDSDIPF